MNAMLAVEPMLGFNVLLRVCSNVQPKRICAECKILDAQPPSEWNYIMRLIRGLCGDGTVTILWSGIRQGLG